MKRLLVIILLACTGTAFAQQDVQFTQYMHNKILLNPGYTGIEGAICATLTHRTQWMSFAGAPVTQNFNVHMPIKKIKGGLGLNMTFDRLGKEVNNSFALNYSFHKDLGPGRLGIGAGLGFLGKSITGVLWIAPDGTSGSSDPSIPQGVNSDFIPDFSFGAYYTTDKFFVGLSSTHLAEMSADLQATSVTQVRHYYFITGYEFMLGANMAIKPSAMIRSDLTSTNFDLNATAVFQDRFWAGLSYRIEDAMAIMFGLDIVPGLRFGYSYDITTSDLKDYGSGSHELFLRYCFTVEKVPGQPERYRNVRFL